MPESHPALAIRYAMRTDIGQLRDSNEDSAYAGPRLLAVADGMGGHVGGEVASAAAIEALKSLDAEDPAVPADDLLSALEGAVRRADSAMQDIVRADPSLRGMGTTLTAILWSGSKLGLAHIGDSRAYLLRDGELSQLTHDHTLVQSLVDEGRITAEEAASYPHQLLLRALGDGSSQPDLELRDARTEDRYLLCSDGLYDVVPAGVIRRVLRGTADPDQAAAKLIELANEGGGPDNITCIVADVVALDDPVQGRR